MIPHDYMAAASAMASELMEFDGEKERERRKEKERRDAFEAFDR